MQNNSLSLNTKNLITSGYFKYGQARRRRNFLWLVAPALIWFTLLMIWPLINMFYISTLKWDGLTKPSRFIGLANYVSMLKDERLLHSIINTGIHLLITVPIVIFPAFMLGFFLSQKGRGYRFFRIIFFSPALISLAALAMLFTGVYLPDGILNAILRYVGLASLTRVWLADMSTALGAVIAPDLWAGIGFWSVLFFAALSNIPNDIYEAARIDGAKPWTIMWRMAFPLTMDFFGVAIMLQFLWTIQAAQLVLLLTKGGPGDSSLLLPFHMYYLAFMAKHLGDSQAVAVVIFVIGIIGIVIIRRIFRRSY